LSAENEEFVRQIMESVTGTTQAEGGAPVKKMAKLFENILLSPSGEERMSEASEDAEMQRRLVACARFFLQCKFVEVGGLNSISAARDHAKTTAPSDNLSFLYQLIEAANLVPEDQKSWNTLSYTADYLMKGKAAEDFREFLIERLKDRHDLLTIHHLIGVMRHELSIEEIIGDATAKWPKKKKKKLQKFVAGSWGAATEAWATRKAREAREAREASKARADAREAAKQRDTGPHTAEHFRSAALLGVSASASDAEIRKAYRKAALKHHPDKGGDAEQFKAVTAAFEFLSSHSEQREREAQERAAAQAAQAEAKAAAAEAALRQELEGLKMTALLKRARAGGIDQESLDEVQDGESPKDALIALLVDAELRAGAETATPAAADAKAAAEAEADPEPQPQPGAEAEEEAEEQ